MRVGVLMRSVVLISIVLLAMSALAACGEEEPTVLNNSGTEFAFGAPQTVEAGAATVNFSNTGAQNHEAILVRLEQGKTLPDLLAAF